MTAKCRRVRQHLGAFVDGELTGADRLWVSQHLSACPTCTGEEREIRDLGDLLRGDADATSRVDMSGLAGGVISRVRAEQAQSWRAVFGRAVEDWHWALVGAGSVAAGFFSIVFVAALLWFGPAPQRADSLEAVLNNLGTPAGTLLIMASPAGRDQDSVVMQFDSGTVGADSPLVAVPVGFSGPSESDLVLALSDAVVSPDGRMSDLRSMSVPNRARAEGLLDEIQRLRQSSPTPWSGGRVEIRRLGLVTNTICTAKALAP